MSLVDVLGGLLRPAVCLACGAPGAWPCCVRCLPAEPDDVGPWPLAADPEVALWALGPYRDALRAAVLAGKLDGQPAALTELGRRLGIALATAGVGADLVTYVAAAQVPGPPRDHAERVAADLYGGTIRADPGRATALLHGCTRVGPPRGYLYQLAAGAGWTSLPLLPCIRQPTLLLAGDDDPIIPLVNAHIMRRLLPRAELHVYHGGHLGLLTEAAQLAPVVDRFLRDGGHPTRGSDPTR